MVQVALDNAIPVIGPRPSITPKGAAAVYGVDPYQDDVDSGDLVVQFSDGDLDLAQEEIQIQIDVLLTVNPEIAEAQDVKKPQSLIDKAYYLIEGRSFHLHFNSIV